MRKSNHTPTLILSALLSLLFFRAAGQAPPSWTWAQAANGPGVNRGILTASDVTGNVYQTGSFVNNLQLGTAALTSVPRDMYLVKYNAQGAVQWARQARVQSALGSNAPQAEGVSVTTDPAGNVYVSGNFTGSVTFGTTVLTATSGISNTFVVKYNDQGTALWALNSTAGATFRTDPSGIAANANGEVFVSGSFSGITTFGGFSVLSQGGLDMFLMKISPAGVVQWLQSAGGTGTDYAGALAPGPANGVYISGGLSSTATFSSLTVTSRGGTDAYLARYDAQGNIQWVQNYGGASNDGAGAMAVSPTGEIYNVGYFQGTATFGPQALTSQGLSDGYVMKCTAQGTPIWTSTLGGSGTDGAYGVALSTTGSLYAVGSFTATATFGAQTRSSVGGTDIFVARYTTTGALVWVDRCGGTGNEYDAGVACGSNGAIYVGGQFSGAAQFGTLSLSGQGATSGFVAQVQDNTPTAVRISAAPAQFTIYPNPVTGSSVQVEISTPVAGPAVLEILDATGRQIQSRTVQPSQFINRAIAVDTRGFTPGMYILKYLSQGETSAKAFMVQ